MKELHTDPEREGKEEYRNLTGIYVRAYSNVTAWGSHDIAELDSASLLAWLKRDGGDNKLAENVVAVLLNHPLQ